MAVPVMVENEVMVGKSLKSKTFGMEFNASVVKALTSTLYNYKIEAVVREYATNITDSHNDAGKVGVAGEITVPTKLNPLIEFMDSGLGMSEEDIYEIYTVLGKSTKRGDNTTSGSLGFGAKSFIAKSDQMTVTSVKDGTRTVVVCYMNKFGELTADTKSKTSTEEDNGTKVSIPVNLNEVDSWQNACARVLGAFRIPHKVNTFGAYQKTYDTIHQVVKSVREEGYAFIQSPNYVLRDHRNNHLALMGDILYEIPSCESLVGKSGIQTVAKNLLSSGFYVTNFNIGDLDHAPSREAISFDKDTYRKIKLRINQDLKQEYSKFKERFGKIGGDVSFYKFYHEYYGTDAWDVLEDLTLPFTKGTLLKYLSPYYKSGSSYVKRMFLLDKGSIKGLVPYANGNYGGTTYSSAVQSFYQDRLLDIKSPVVMYSEGDKGPYKITKTLENAQKHLGEGTHILICEDEGKAKLVADWFGSDKIIVADQFSPKKESPKNSNSRKKFGVKSNFETVATVTILGEGNNYTTSQQKVDLSDEGVVFMPLGGISVSGIVPKHETKFSGSTYFHKFLREIGMTKLVFENKNNSGKIRRSGVKNLKDLLTEKVKLHKREILSYRIWSINGLRYLDDKKNLIADLKPFKKKYMEELNHKQDTVPMVKILSELSDWGLPNTKIYEKLKNQKLAMENKVIDNVNSVMKELPLADKFSCYDEKDLTKFKYYLKLEKIIK
ncbi:histidine kinase-like ATPase [Vibrio phage 1.170.O._10N.261.52.C3]|nr:histidine kinase-like ATPase [Vibrio phage 1.170.O._10N.261.52.C3]